MLSAAAAAACMLLSTCLPARGVELYDGDPQRRPPAAARRPATRARRRPAPGAPRWPPTSLRCIVTGFEHAGTTVVSELIMSTPGLYGPFEMGFLTAASPGSFREEYPFFTWSGADFPDADPNRKPPLPYLRLSTSQREELLKQKTHLAMYDHILRVSPLLANSTGVVDKTPKYSRDLVRVMLRAPAVPVVLVTKTFEHLRASARKHPKSFHAFVNGYPIYEKSIAAAKRKFGHRIHEVSFENLFVDTCRRGQEVRKLFRFLALPFNRTYFDCSAIRRKRVTAQLCESYNRPRSTACSNA